MRLHIDLETRSTVDLRKTGVHVYAQHPSTEVLLACWAVDDEPVQTWYCKDPCPDELHGAMLDADVIVAHNAGFERAMIEYVLGPRIGFPVPNLRRWDDTAARAARQSLPRSLDGAANALGLQIKKDDEGKRLMLQMCKPRSPRKSELPDKIYWFEDAARMKRLAEYCAVDVEVERQLDKVLRQLTDSETEIWQLTEKINDRGVRVDVPFVEKALTVAELAQKATDAEMFAITDGQIGSVTRVAQIKSWLSEKGFAILETEDDSLNKKAVENLLARDLPDDVRRVLELRQDGGKSSVAKYLAMKQRACDDGRVRGNLMYHGASTGRWSGAGVQLQNLPRDTVKDWEWSRDNLDSSDPKTMGTLSRMIRGCIIPDEGNKLMWVDYASVEARGVAWLAGQKDLVSLFSANGKIYEEMASKVFNVPVQDIGKDSKERFIGKTVVLGCGYSMGALRFRQQCAAMGTDIDEELAQRAVDAYRQGYPMIPALWRGLNNACIASVESMGTKTTYQSVQFMADRHWLVIRLPSGRKLFYRTPRIIQVSGPFGDRPNIEYMSVNSFTKKWQWERTFGGKLTENIVQALCRDLIADAMLRLDRNGYEVIASVHDEVICEVPVDGHYTLDEMTKLMCELPDWATGFPLSAEGKEGKRYGK